MLRLKAHDLDTRDPSLIVRGRVVDEQGAPVPDALVEPFGFGKSNSVQFGGLKGFDPLALTSQKGDFRLGIPEKEITLYVQVSARGFARRNFNKLPAGKAHDLRLDHGVTVTGRTVKGGRPMPGLALGLVQESRSAMTFLGDYKAATDDNGVFTILNVPANDAFVLYGLMDSLKVHGAIAARKLQTQASDTKAEVGDLAVEPGYSLSGKLVLSDGKPIPTGTQVMVARQEAWDTQQTVVGNDGAFAFAGLPAEQYSLSANVRGYRVSAKNASLDLLNPFRLVGMVHSDITGLRLLYEIGQVKGSGKPDHEEYQRRRNVQLRGAPEE
jgi:hypothetical protein